MKVICAGMPKTGTKSLAAALRILGYNVHDNMDQLFFHMNKYTLALEGKDLPNFKSMYEDVDATTDMPACYYFEEIFHSFPEAKVILSMREDEDVWYQSYMHTVGAWQAAVSRLWVILAYRITPTGRRWERFNAALNNSKYKNYNEKVLRQLYNDHNTRVKAVIPRDHLLVFNMKKGWEPLCAFLGVDVPDVPFPRLNVKSQAVRGFIDDSIIGKQMLKELVLLFIVLTVFVGVMVVILV